MVNAKFAPQRTVRTAESGQTDFDELKRLIHGKLVDKLDLTRLGDLEGDTLRREIRLVVEHLCDTENPLLNRSEREKLIEEVLDETFGFGPLEALLKEEGVADIMINGPKNVFLEKQGRIQRSKITFRDNDHLMQILDRIVSKVGRRIDETSPMCDARLPDGSRVNAIIPPLALDGPAITIRRFGANPLTLEDLLRFGAFTPEMVMLLEGGMKARLNMIVSGGTGSGKTTLLNTLSSFIPSDQRIITIEDAAELQLQQEHVLRLETRPSNIEGKGRIGATDLVRNALRMRPDRIIIGECRGPEALDMLQAMNTGHEGSLTTIHANSPRDAVSRLETMITMGGIDIPLKALRHQFASAVDLIIQANRLQGGPRKVTHITEVLNMEQDTVIMQDIFLFVQDGIDETGRGVRALYLDGRSSGVYGTAGIGRRPLARQPVCRPETRTVIHASPGSFVGISVMNPLIIMVAAFVGVTALIVGIAAMAGVFDTSKAEDRLAVMTRRKGRENEAEGVILDELFPEAKAGLIGIVEAFFHRVGRFSRALHSVGLSHQAGSVLRADRRLCLDGRHGHDHRPCPGPALSAGSHRAGHLALDLALDAPPQTIQEIRQTVARRAGTHRAGVAVGT